jgi:hypothetical protein
MQDDEVSRSIDLICFCVDCLVFFKRVPDLNFGFKGKLAMVAGGANGIGFATARLLAAHGASVGLFDLEREILRRRAADNASKAGLPGLGRTAANELGPDTTRYGSLRRVRTTPLARIASSTDASGAALSPYY